MAWNVSCAPQVGDVIESALAINAVPDTDCRAGSSSCMYKYNWKCSDLDSEEDKPKEQHLVTKGASGVELPETLMKSFFNDLF